MEQEKLLQKIEELPPELRAEVEDFVESLARRQDNLVGDNLHKALSDYARQHARTPADLDEDLEAESVNQLLQSTT